MKGKREVEVTSTRLVCELTEHPRDGVYHGHWSGKIIKITEESGVSNSVTKNKTLEITVKNGIKCNNIPIELTVKGGKYTIEFL